MQSRSPSGPPPRGEGRLSYPSRAREREIIWLAFGAGGGVRGDGAAEIGNRAADIQQVVIAKGHAVLEWRKADHRRRGREIRVVESQHRASPAEQPAGFEADPGAAPGHLHAAGIRLQ